MIFVIGGNGRLGRAIAAEYGNESVIVLDRAVYQDWSLSMSADDVTRYFEKIGKENATVVVTAGLLDPTISQDNLMRVNFQLPKTVIAGASKLGYKVVTFGTVMECLLKSQNPYIQSKALLGNYVANVASANCQALHLRIHTLFGMGAPSQFMFLGQMLDALQKNRPFKMTLGKQLREYHHVQDEAKAIRKIVSSVPCGIMDVSHGEPVSLKEIAESIFSSFGKENFLCLGALPEPPEDNFGQALKRPAILKDILFRETLPAVVDYMKTATLAGSANSEARFNG